MHPRFSRSVGFLSLPIGFSASPAYFEICTSPIQRIHQNTKPEDCSWNDAGNRGAFLYIDDGIFAEAELGTRSADCIRRWGEIAKQVLGDERINQNKIAGEGEWSEEDLVLGFALNTSTLEIKVSDVKVQGAADFLLYGIFGEGLEPLGIKPLQTLRGIIAH